MTTTDLLLICVAAFLTVFIILVVLSLIMRLIILIFPQKEEGFDGATLSAITTTYQAIYPGTKVTKIEAEK